MLKKLTALHQKTSALDEKMEHMFFVHPCVALFLSGIVAPIVVLGAVFLGTCIVALPVGAFLGWL